MKQENRSMQGIIFLTVFLNLMSFTVILPLSPSLLEYYLPGQQAAGGMIGHFVETAHRLAGTIEGGDPVFLTSMFFGCMLASVFAFLQFAAAPFWGRLSDRFGRRPTLLITTGGTLFAYALWFFADSFEVFILSRVLAGIMAGSLTVATAAIADLTSTNKRMKGMALVGAAFGLGFLVGPALGGLATKINLTEILPSWVHLGVNPFSFPALLAVCLTTIDFLWILTKFRETLPLERRGKKRFALDPEDKLKIKHTPIRITTLVHFIFILSFSGLEYTLVFLATERFGFGPMQNGYLFLFIGSILVFTQGLFLRRVKIEEKTLAIMAMISGTISFAILAFAVTLKPFLVGSAFLAISISLASASLTSLVSLYATEKTQGRYLGILRSAGSLGRAVGPFIIALIYFYHGAQSAYLAGAAALVGPILLILSLPKPKKDAAEDIQVTEQAKQ